MANLRHRAPSPSPSPSAASPSSSSSTHSTSRQPVDFSPPLIAMVVVVAAAFIIVTYSRLISRRLVHPMIRLLHFFRRRRRRYLPSTTTDFLDSPPLSDHFFDLPLSPYGLDEAAIKTLPLSLYKPNNNPRECAVCLLEFEDDEYVRTLPVCSHAFHVDCIDVWLKSHANCPLCRAGIFGPRSPFVPLMAARIRPSLDDAVLIYPTHESPSETPLAPIGNSSTHTEITEEASPRRTSANFNASSCDERFHFVLKRSHSFGFERSIAAERLVTEANTASPWRFRRGGSGGGFWSKRMSPFGSLMAKPRVLSFRYYRSGMKASPFLRRRSGAFLPLSESSVRWSRRSKSMASPMFVRSSRMRCGDPEALVSPERLNRR